MYYISDMTDTTYERGRVLSTDVAGGSACPR